MVSTGWWCKTCHKPVSKDAVTCPHCGQPDPATSEVPTEAKLQAVGTIGGCLLIIVVGFICAAAK
jgi:predicted amidophosphoribosyltransferase